MPTYVAIFREENSNKQMFKLFSSIEGYENFKKENPTYTFIGLFEQVCL